MSLILYKQVNPLIKRSGKHDLALNDGHIILKDPQSRSVVVYNHSSEELTIYQQSSETGVVEETQFNSLIGTLSPPSPENQVAFSKHPDNCPTCGQQIPSTLDQETRKNSSQGVFGDYVEPYMHENYFKILNKGLLDSGISAHKGIPPKLFTQGYYKEFFQELGQLGVGARGSVYKVQHVLLNSLNLGIYALKKIPIGDDMKWLTKSLEEVKLLSKITNSHPNLIGYNHVWLEMDKTNGIVTGTDSEFLIPCVFILQQYCAGGNLEDCLINQVWKLNQNFESATMRKMKHKLRKNSATGKEYQENNTLQNSQIISILRDIATGLVKLHELGIIHRDLKPSNCLLDSEYIGATDSFPSVVIGDFGESQFDGQLRSRTGCTGTTEFTAPEVLMTKMDGLSSSEFTFKSDMYSLGMIGYYLIFQKLPWKPYSTLDELKNMVKKQTFDYESLVAQFGCKENIDQKLFYLLENLLSHDPDMRFSAKEVVTFLNEINTTPFPEQVIDKEQDLNEENLIIEDEELTEQSKPHSSIKNHDQYFKILNVVLALLFIINPNCSSVPQINYVMPSEDYSQKNPADVSRNSRVSVERHSNAEAKHGTSQSTTPGLYLTSTNISSRRNADLRNSHILSPISSTRRSFSSSRSSLQRSRSQSSDFDLFLEPTVPHETSSSSSPNLGKKHHFYSKFLPRRKSLSKNSAAHHHSNEENAVSSISKILHYPHYNTKHGHGATNSSLFENSASKRQVSTHVLQDLITQNETLTKNDVVYLHDLIKNMPTLEQNFHQFSNEERERILQNTWHVYCNICFALFKNHRIWNSEQQN
ncbi:hypothetical protein ACO0QE_004067 [Hanseniaspora vineae]